MIQLHEIFYSIQGEGAFTGTPAVFVRLAGCNLSCRFCDTDYSLKELASVWDVAQRVAEVANGCPMVILTGGEPLAQSDCRNLIAALRESGRRIHIESNGTIDTPLDEDIWLTISPKERLSRSMAERADEAKLIVDKRVPLEWIEQFPAKTMIFLQPEGNKPDNVELALEALKQDPKRLRLSLQTHKFIGVK